MNLTRIVFIFFLCAVIENHFFCLFAQQASPINTSKVDSLLNPYQAYLFVRGLERDEQKSFNPLRSIWNYATFLPKRVSYAIRFASGYGAQLIDDPKLINEIEDFFFTDNRRFGWYPIFNFTSGFRPRIGANLIYKYDGLRSVLKGRYADKEKFKTEARLSYRLKRGTKIWQFTISSYWGYDDDREFYGIGHFPQLDHRSHFIPNSKHEFGVYFQENRGIEFVIGLRPFTHWEFFLTNLYEDRKFEDASKGDVPLSDSYDLTKIVGLNKGLPYYYHEISTRFDTRDLRTHLWGGIKFEGYLGVSRGTCENKCEILKTGFNLIKSIPVIQQNRVLMPRLSFHKIKNLKDTPIPFIDYPTHDAFRGVPTRKLLRTDNYSLVPSLEYQWPISFNLGGHLFFDHLLVADKLKSFTVRNAPWAIGVGVDFHTIDGELARGIIAIGSEGLHVSMDLGWNLFN